jgi:hypothetical protein
LRRESVVEMDVAARKAVRNIDFCAATAGALCFTPTDEH